MSRLRPALALGATLTVLAAGAAGCGSDSSDSDSAATPPAATSTSTAAAPAAGGELTPAKDGVVTVAYKDFAIDPAEIVIKAGTKVTWTNGDTSTHNAVVKEGAPEMMKTKDFGKGETDSLTFTKPGVYEYLCTFHAASMQGKITVQG